MKDRRTTEQIGQTLLKFLEPRWKIGATFTMDQITAITGRHAAPDRKALRYLAKRGMIDMRRHRIERNGKKGNSYIYTIKSDDRRLLVKGIAGYQEWMKKKIKKAKTGPREPRKRIAQARNNAMLPNVIPGIAEKARQAAEACPIEADSGITDNVREEPAWYHDLELLRAEIKNKNRMIAQLEEDLFKARAEKEAIPESGNGFLDIKRCPGCDLNLQRYKEMARAQGVPGILKDILEKCE